jgi:class 3 adenylate cyclase
MQPNNESIDRVRLSVPEIRRVWQSRLNDYSEDTAWRSFVQTSREGTPLAERYANLAAQALSQGETFLAQDIAREGKHVLEKHVAGNRSVSSAETYPVRAQLTHSIALSHARQGLHDAALSEISRLERDYPESAHTPNLVGLRARIFKNLAQGSADSTNRIKWFERSHEAYLQGFDLARSTKREQDALYLGVNAAATAVWLDDYERAAELAREVDALASMASGNDYWKLATRGEAMLIQRRMDESFAAYQRARVEISQSRRWADLAAARQQARLLCDSLLLDFHSLDEAFDFPKYCVFSGHMVDAPGRARARLPNTREAREALHKQLRERIANQRIQFAVCSAACGADLIFVDEMLLAGGEVHIVIPWPREQFIESSVAPGGEYWLAEFNRLMDRANSVTYLTQQSLPDKDGIAFEFCNYCISGIAMQRARSLSAELVPMAVWDGRPGSGLGGTASFVDFWESLGHTDFWLPTPKGVGKSESSARVTSLSNRNTNYEIGNGRFVIKTMLFADVVGYSKIPEAQVRSFPVAFLGPIAELISNGRAGRPILSNTWGDAIFLVFDYVSEAGSFALAVRRLIAETDWTTHGLPKLNIRIGLHTGPVLLCIDPVLNRLTFTGPHVNHAARIEPIVVPGEVYATEGFVAHAEIERYRGNTVGFQCEYVGEMEFAKSYGRFPLFRLSESTEAK